MGFEYFNGNSTPNNGTLTITSGAVTGNSSNVSVNYSNIGTITAGPAAEPLTISSSFNETCCYTTLPVFDFNIVDDGGSGGDGAPTQVTQIVFTQGTGNGVATWTDAIYAAKLSDGTNTIFTASITANTITFPVSGSLGLTGDNGTHKLSIICSPENSCIWWITLAG
ncbi:MAG: hypothetical protein WDN75_10680 [Bacteroidota bacterium]